MQPPSRLRMHSDYGREDGLVGAQQTRSHTRRSMPGAWPPTDVGAGRLCIDGGIWAITNADVAGGAGHVSILALLCYGDDNPIGGVLRAEIATLEAAGCMSTVITPDAASDQAMSDTMLDPARRAGSFRAGLDQAKRRLVS